MEILTAHNSYQKYLIGYAISLPTPDKETIKNLFWGPNIDVSFITH